MKLFYIQETIGISDDGEVSKLTVEEFVKETDSLWDAVHEVKFFWEGQGFKIPYIRMRIRSEIYPETSYVWIDFGSYDLFYKLYFKDSELEKVNKALRDEERGNENEKI